VGLKSYAYLDYGKLQNMFFLVFKPFRTKTDFLLQICVVANIYISLASEFLYSYLNQQISYAWV
jgi:ribosome biogenesis protein Nip4